MTDVPRLAACYFGQPQGTFARMAAVLAHSASVRCSDWAVSIEHIEPTPRRSFAGVDSYAQNAQKVEHWTSVVDGAPDGTRLLLLDVDTVILRPLDDVWDLAFDVAYTVKRNRFPFNLGVLFVRVSPSVREFFTAWRDENLLMLQDRKSHNVWRPRYGGINQASFGMMLERGALNRLQVLTLPCAEWNCEESGWPTFDPAVTRILHVKGELRHMVFRRRDVQPAMAPMVTLYRAMEHAIKAQTARTA